jgi:hypothetical protein
MKSLDLLALAPLANAGSETVTNESTSAVSAKSPLPRKSSATAPAGVSVGTFAGFSTEGLPLVELPQRTSAQPLAARTTIPLTVREVGREVVIVFEEGSRERPIITGLLQSVSPASEAAPVDVRLDGEQLVFSAEREIVLRCGKSSITLTRAGKVLIRGAYLLSRSSGVNRIKGGSVQIN